MQQSAANLHQMDLVGIIVSITVHSQQSTVSLKTKDRKSHAHS